MNLTIVVPCYNKEAVVAVTAERLQGLLSALRRRRIKCRPRGSSLRPSRRLERFDSPAVLCFSRDASGRIERGSGYRRTREKTLGDNAGRQIQDAAHFEPSPALVHSASA